MAVWYELRYPNKYLDKEDIDKVMFGESNDINIQNWSEFYNFDKFLYSMP